MSELIRAFRTLELISEAVSVGTLEARSSDHDKEKAYKDMFEALEEIGALALSRIADLHEELRAMATILGKPGDTP